jgi:quercetin dioxygenase-like cupin family protein
MNDETIFIKSGDQKKEITRPGRTYRLKIKSEKTEAIIAEIDPKRESRWYQHAGEEIHLVLEGKMEYTVGEKTYKLNKGDILWHKSNFKHRAKNIGNKKVKYITIGTPPTFITSDL